MEEREADDIRVPEVREGRDEEGEIGGEAELAKRGRKKEAVQAEQKALSMRDRMSDSEVDFGIISVAKRLQWYALWVPPSKEFVAQKILRRYGLRTYVPVRREWRRKNKYSKQKELQTYAVAPRYVFAGFEPGEPLWFDIFSLPVISGVVTFEGRPVRIPSGAIVDLLKKKGQGLNAPAAQKYMRTHHEFEAGSSVEVIGGPFEGRVVPVKEISGVRATLLMEIFGSQMEVLVPLDMLQAA